MAKLSSNGTEVARFEKADSRVSYRSTGAVLIDYGYGWKHAMVKSKDPVADAAKQTASRASRPCRTAWHDGMAKAFPNLTVRVRVANLMHDFKDAQELWHACEADPTTKGKCAFAVLTDLLALRCRARQELTESKKAKAE